MFSHAYNQEQQCLAALFNKHEVSISKKHDTLEHLCVYFNPLKNSVCEGVTG